MNQYLFNGNRITNSFVTEEEIVKGEEIRLGFEETNLMKGKPIAPIGTKKDISGRTYIKTADGWKYYGKGTGHKAQEHGGKAKVAAGGGAAIKPGSKITANGITGTVKHYDEHETHIEYQDKNGKTQLSRQATSHIHQQIQDKNFDHSVPAHESGKVGGAGDGAEGPAYDINKRFKAFALYTKAVIAGKMKSMIAYGTGGVGKTYTITQELKAAGKKPFDEETMVPGDDEYDYVKITGKMTAPELYKAMYQHNGKIMMFDDCDSVLRDGSCINLFKGALDTSGDGTISYGTKSDIKDDDNEKIPKRFKFSGRALFASNLPPDQIPQPLKSRGYSVDLSMNKDQTMDRLKAIATDKKSGKLQNLQFPGIDKYSHKDMEEVLSHLNEVKDKMHADLSVRTIGSMLGIKQMAEEGGEDWKESASHMLFSKSQEMNIFDGSEIQKSQRAQMLKSYGINTTAIKKSSDVTSKNYNQLEEEGEEVKKGEEIIGIAGKNRDGQEVIFNKGQIADRLVYGYGGGTTKPLEFTKTGAELKAKIPTVLAALNMKKGEIIGKMDLLKQQVGSDPTQPWHTDAVSGIIISRYPWEMCNAASVDSVKAVESISIEPTMTGVGCNDYNEWCWTLRDLIDDINALSVIQANLEDKKQYTLSVGQLMALQFN